MVCAYQWLCGVCTFNPPRWHASNVRGLVCPSALFTSPSNLSLDCIDKSKIKHLMGMETFHCCSVGFGPRSYAVLIIMFILVDDGRLASTVERTETGQGDQQMLSANWSSPQHTLRTQSLRSPYKKQTSGERRSSTTLGKQEGSNFLM